MTETHSTMMSEDGLSVGMISAHAWNQVVEHFLDDPSQVDEDTWTSWQAAGLVTQSGVDPKWKRAIEVVNTATTGMELLSRYTNVAFHAVVFVLEDDMVTVTSRYALEEGDDAWHATGMHPLMEIALASANDPWRLLLRVLPPLDQVRATPRMPSVDEIRPLSLDDVNIPAELRADPKRFAEQVVSIPQVPADIRDACQAVATVFAFGLGKQGEQVVTTEDIWLVGSEQLFHSMPDQQRLVAVPKGQLGAQLVARLRELNNQT